jgi:Carbohydrate binding domain
MSRAQLTSTVEQSSGGAVAPFLAGKNKIINGDFGIWQRGTSFTMGSSSPQYTADRFWCRTTQSGTSTLSQQAFTPGSAPVAGYESKYYLRYTLGTSATDWNLYQKIEDVQTLAGQTVTLSFWAKSSVNQNIQVILRQDFGTGGSSYVDGLSTNQTLSSSWTRYSFTATLPSIAGKTIGTGSNLSVLLYYNSGSISSQTLDFWGFQVEAGSVATPFTTASNTLQGELALCQRYYFRTNATSNPYSIVGYFVAANSNGGNGQIQLPVAMRTAPASVDASASSSFFLQAGSGSSSYTITSAITLNASTNGLTMGTISASTAGGLTTDKFYLIVANNTTSAYIGFSAEL